MADIGDALEALRDAIALIDGTGDYTYDLTGANSVTVGVSEDAPTYPHIAIMPYASGAAETGNTLDAVTHTWQIAIVGRVAAATDSELARFQAASLLYHDVLDALKIDRTLGGIARDVESSNPEIFATAQGVLPAEGAFIAPIQIEIKRGYVG